MSVEAIDLTKPIGEVEERVFLESLGGINPELMLCTNASEEDMAYGVDGRKSRSDLAPEEEEAVKAFCGPCSQQEACLAKAIIGRNLTRVVEGGLNSRGRFELRKHYDKDEKSVPKGIWDIAIDAILEGEAPYFPGQSGPLPKAPVKRKIIEYLARQPDMTLIVEGHRSIYTPLAKKVDAEETVVKSIISELHDDKVVAKKKDGIYLVSINLVA